MTDSDMETNTSTETNMDLILENSEPTLHVAFSNPRMIRLTLDMLGQTSKTIWNATHIDFKAEYKYTVENRIMFVNTTPIHIIDANNKDIYYAGLTKVEIKT